MNSKKFSIVYIENDKNKIDKLSNAIKGGTVTTNFIAASSQDELAKAYEDGNCNLVICSGNQLVPLPNIKTLVGESVSILYLGKEQDAASSLIKKGATLFSYEGDLEYVTHIVRRLINVAYKLQELQEKLNLVDKFEEKSAQFMLSANDPIAYISDGFFSFTNDAFIEYFTQDAIDNAIGINDFLTPEDQKKYKQLSKELMQTQGQVETNFSITNPKTNQIEQINVLLKAELYQDEKCLSFNILMPSASDQQENRANLEEVSQLHQRIAKESDKIVTLTSLLKERDGKLIELEKRLTQKRDKLLLLNQELEDKNKIISSQTQPVSANYTPDATASTYHKRFVSLKEIEETKDAQSWLILFNMIDFKLIWAKYGAIVATQYFDELIEHLSKIQPGLKIIEGYDGSLLFYLKNIDLQSVDALSSALRGEAENFHYISEEGINITSRCLSAITSLGDSNTVIQNIQQLEIKTRVYDKVVDERDETEDEKIVDIEMLLYENIGKALASSRAKIQFLPIVSYNHSSHNHYQLLPIFTAEDGKNIEYRFNQASDITHPTMIKVDQWMLESAVESLKTAATQKEVVFINFSLSSIKNQKFIEWLKAKLSSDGFPMKQIIFGCSEYILENHSSDAKNFLNLIKEFGKDNKTWIAGVTGDMVNVFDQISQLHIDYAMISSQLVNRVSRSRDELIKKAFVTTVNEIKNANCLSIATAVDSPTQMALVWESNIPFALGTMVGNASQTMDFNFSTLMI